MEKVGSTKQVNVVCQLDREGDGGTWRYYVKKDDDPAKIGSRVVETLPEQDMGSAETFRAFVEWGMAKYPSRKTMVVLWNHGTGWEKGPRRQFGTKGISYDDQSGNHITVGQVGQVLREVAAARERKIDVLGYDACLMQMAEVAAEAVDSCSYQVAAEETEPVDGWPYDTWLAQVVEHPEWDGAEVGRALVDAFKTSYTGGSQGSEATTLSLVDLARLSQVTAAADRFTQALLAEQADRPKVLEAMSSSQAYQEPDHKDLVDFADQVAQRVSAPAVVEAAAALKSAVTEQAVLASCHTGERVGRSHGLAIWIPTRASQGLMDRYRELRWAASGQWDEFVGALSTDAGSVARSLVVADASGTPAASADVALLATGLAGLTIPATMIAREAVAAVRAEHPESASARDLLRALNAAALDARR
jgi:hypothetical protein